MPSVAIYNNVETFYGFLRRAEDAAVLQTRMYRGDRALFWLGDPKLVIVTAPVPHAAYVREQLGYPGTECVAPAEPSPALSFDILRDPALMQRLVDYAGPGRALQLIPYATTRQFMLLADTLQNEHGLTIHLPESPARDALWLRDYADTKAGFRTLAARWLANSMEVLPYGVVCRSVEQAAEAAYWANRQGRATLVKADGGESGLGHTLLPAQPPLAAADLLRQLQANPFLRDDLIIVEDFIGSAAHLSPSLELFVPALGQGEPRITYLSQQLFRSFGNFTGVLLSRELLDAPWYPALAESGLTIARQLQTLGYVGLFDLDAIVDDVGRVWLLEINTRRTGGTFVHEFAAHTFGPDYLAHVALLCNAKLPSGRITRLDDLLAVIDDLLYPMGARRRGVVVAVASALAAHEFGCIIVADTTTEALALQTELLKRVAD